MIRIETHTTMKQYNCAHYWIDRDIVPPFQADTDDLQEALKHYVDHVDDYGINISPNAKRRPENVYIDTKDGDTIQTGLCFTGSTYIDDKKQYIELWATITTNDYYFK